MVCARRRVAVGARIAQRAVALQKRLAQRPVRVESEAVLALEEVAEGEAEGGRGRVVDDLARRIAVRQIIVVDVTAGCIGEKHFFSPEVI